MTGSDSDTQSEANQGFSARAQEALTLFLSMLSASAASAEAEDNLQKSAMVSPRQRHGLGRAAPGMARREILGAKTFSHARLSSASEVARLRFLFDKETMSNVIGAMKSTPPVAPRACIETFATLLRHLQCWRVSWVQLGSPE